MSKPTPEGRNASRIPALFALVAALLCASLLAPAAAVAATAPAYDPTFVISDEVFRASAWMTQADIQAFLETRNGVLDTTLVARRSDETTVPVSQAIWEVSQEFNINPKVLLVTLQKEQSLLEAAAPSQYQLDWALGFGCPDGVPVDQRDPAYKGLGKQIWYAADALNRYGEDFTKWHYWVPNKAKALVPSGSIVPKNLATWKLYIYTPVTGPPNGNYLFWTLYWKYFDEGPLANPALRPVFRFYNKKNGSHFYTTSDAERISVTQKLADIYTYEGAAYWVNSANPANAVPLYRFYNKKNGTHFYTASEDEKNQVIAKLSGTYTFEGPAYSVSMAAEGATPVYRFYNKKIGSHFYTTSDAERDSVIAKLASTYTFEGVAYYLAP